MDAPRHITRRVAAALRRAGLPEPVQVQLLSGGFANITTLAALPRGRGLVVTLNRGVSRERALRTFALHHALYLDGRVPVAEPLQAVEVGEELALIKVFVPGQAGGDLGPARLEAAAKALRALHELPRALAPEGLGALSYGIEAWDECAGWGDGHRAVTRCLARWRQALTDAGFFELPRAIIHGDVDSDNVVWAVGGAARVEALIDWEEAAIYPRLWDLAGLVGWGHWDLLGWDPALIEAALRGYGPIADAERGAFRLVAGANLIANAFWFYRKHLWSGELEVARGGFQELRRRAAAISGFGG